jgi:hypothetical protein
LISQKNDLHTRSRNRNAFSLLEFLTRPEFRIVFTCRQAILSRRHIPEAHDFEVFRLSGLRLPRGIGANQRSSRVLHFRIAQDADHGQLSRDAVGCPDVARCARDLRQTF